MHNRSIDQAFAFDAGSPALNFVNWARLKGMRDYADLVAGAAQLGLVNRGRSTRLPALAQAAPFRADGVVAEARILARVIHRIFAAIARDNASAAGDLEFLSEALGNAMAHIILVPTSPPDVRSCDWAWRDDHKADLDCMLWPVVRDAAELLVGQDPTRIRLCQGNGCDRLYLDTSKAGRRRWCQMETCGNRAKARRYARRHTGPPA